MNSPSSKQASVITNPTFWEAFTASLALIRYQGVLIIIHAIFPAAGVFMLVAICLAGFEKGSLQFLPICVCAILFTPIIVAFQTLMRRRNGPITKGPFTFTFNAEGIRTKGAAFDQLIQWAGIVRVRQSKRFLFLFVSRSKALFIPVKALEEQSVLETVREIVREHAPAIKA